jgi:hypothetical protein
MSATERLTTGNVGFAGGLPFNAAAPEPVQPEAQAA